MALVNVSNYESHLNAARAKVKEPELVSKVLGIKNGKPSPELLKFVQQEIDGMLAEESTYVAECIASLNEQKSWHEEGGVNKGAFLPADAEKKFEDLVTRGDSEKIKTAAKYAYYAPIRNRLMSMGFVVSPPGTALGAVFPEKDWIKDIASQKEFEKDVKLRTDDLVRRYRLVGDDRNSLTRLLLPEKPTNDTARLAILMATGCLCVSWTRHKVLDNFVYVPVLGLSGVVQSEPKNAFFEKYCRHLGLPSWESDVAITYTFQMSDDLKAKKKEQGQEYEKVKAFLNAAATPEQQEKVAAYKRLQKEAKEQEEEERKTFDAGQKQQILKLELSCNYETMIRRTNRVALGYRARAELGLRQAARQALLSYVSFREKKTSGDLMKLETLQDVKLGVDLWIAGWHSLNCAEPAALVTASSYFCEGCDVLVCFPYEGSLDTGTGQNRPKETCPWCAAVELGFRSVSENKEHDALQTSIDTGDWLTQLTMTMMNEPSEALSPKIEFDAYDSDNEMMKRTRETLGGQDSVKLAKNKDLETLAYSSVIETKIGRVRSMYYMLGLLDPKAIALDRPLFAHAAGSEQVTSFKG
jgi:hypothetical protein